MSFTHRIALALLTLALLIGPTLAIPRSSYAAASTATTIAARGSNGCEISPYQASWGSVKIYLDNCNLTWLIRVLREVGEGWTKLDIIPVPIAKAFSAMGVAQRVVSGLLSRVQQSCGNRGTTIYKHWWMPAPWFLCGKTF